MAGKESCSLIAVEREYYFVLYPIFTYFFLIHFHQSPTEKVIFIKTWNLVTFRSMRVMFDQLLERRSQPELLQKRACQNPLLHLSQVIREKNNFMVFGSYQLWFRRLNKDFCKKSFLEGDMIVLFYNNNGKTCYKKYMFFYLIFKTH